MDLFKSTHTLFAFVFRSPCMHVGCHIGCCIQQMPGTKAYCIPTGQVIIIYVGAGKTEIYWPIGQVDFEIFFLLWFPFEFESYISSILLSEKGLTLFFQGKKV